MLLNSALAGRERSGVDLWSLVSNDLFLIAQDAAVSNDLFLFVSVSSIVRALGFVERR